MTFRYLFENSLLFGIYLKIVNFSYVHFSIFFSKDLSYLYRFGVTCPLRIGWQKCFFIFYFYLFLNV